MVDIFNITQHDLQPYFRFTIPNANDLSASIIVCTMVNLETGDIVINRRSTGVVVTDGAKRQAELRWQSGDTDVTGDFKLEFEITPADGGKFSVPVYPEKQRVRIDSDLDGV